MQFYVAYIPIIGIIISFWIQIYLYLFPFKKLYKEVCVKGENKKSIFFVDKSQLKCLNHVKNDYPKYTQKIEKYIQLDRWNNYLAWCSLILIFILWLFGVIEYKPDSMDNGTFTEKLTVTKIENNKTTVKTYKNLEDFLK